MSLEGEYLRLCGLPSDIQNHLPRFVQMVEELDAKHVIELGTRTGVSTVAWLYALIPRGGRLTSIDLEPAPPLGRWEAWTYIQGDDLNPAVIASLEPADIVFIDTSHLYEPTLAEHAAYLPLVNPGGRLLLHDTQLERPEGAPPEPRFPVRAAIAEFTKAHGFAWTEHIDSFGLGVIEVT